jgi:hypothetical protein
MDKSIGSRARRAVLGIVVALRAGCEWAPPTREGEGATGARPEHVQTCRRIGETTAKVKSEIAGVARSADTVSEELQNLARNAAAGMNGDTVVPVGQPVWGEQRFTVYRCRTGR